MCIHFTCLDNLTRPFKRGPDLYYAVLMNLKLLATCQLVMVF